MPDCNEDISFWKGVHPFVLVTRYAIDPKAPDHLSTIVTRDKHHCIPVTTVASNINPSASQACNSTANEHHGIHPKTDVHPATFCKICTFTKAANQKVVPTPAIIHGNIGFDLGHRRLKQ